MIDIWLIFNLLLPFIEQWSLWFLFPKNDTPPVPYFFSCWLFDSLRSESRSQQEKKAPLLIVLHFFAEYLPPKFSFHFRFRPLLGMKSTFLFCKFWNNFSRNLGIGFLLFSCHSRFFFIPSYSQIARMEPSIPFLEFIGVIFAHPWCVNFTFYVRRSRCWLRIRNDDDREVNHHGRTIEVGEAEREEKGKYHLLFKA